MENKDRVLLGLGWEWDTIKDLYIFNNGEFNIEGATARAFAKNNSKTGLTFTVLNRIYRMHHGYE